MTHIRTLQADVLHKSQTFSTYIFNPSICREKLDTQDPH